MRCFIKTLVAASALLAIIGCSKDWPFERTENGKVEIESGGGEEPEGGIAYPVTIYGNLQWYYQGPAIAVVVVRDANGTCIGKTHEWVQDQGGRPYELCECSFSTESPLPWTIYAAARDPGGTWRMDSEVITSLDTYYTCPGGGGIGIRKKAKQVNLVLYFPDLPDTTSCPECD